MDREISRNIPVEKSVLQIHPVAFDKLSFERIGNRTEDSKIHLEINQRIKKHDEAHYTTTILVKATKEKEFIATVQISGECTVNEKDPNKERLVKENAFFILFPYVRSELTLLTAQPETDPIVFPVMNIQAMMERAEQTEQDKDDDKELNKSSGK